MKKLYFFACIFIIGCINGFAQFVVTPNVTPGSLVGNLVGFGVDTSNVTVNSTSAASNASRGTFSCGGACNLGFGNGIILTSGGATIAMPPNPSSGQGAFVGNGLTDTDLNGLTTGTTEDACVLEFDFSVASDSVRFRYIFGSDEYSDYVNSTFNDVFGFFMSGPGITGTRNLAIIPGTSTPVAINNVNNGGPVTHGTPPPGPCTNCAYFRDNSAPVTLTTAYDGLTTPLTAASTVCPCETYHIKLAIADVTDHVFDSGVLLEGNSFASVGQIEIFANGVAQSSNATIYACTGQSVTLSVLNNLACSSVNYSWNGGLSGTSQSIVVNQANVLPGGYACTVSNANNPGCFTWTTFVHVQFITPIATITPSGSTSLCPGGSVTLTAYPSSSYLWSNGATTQSITVSTAGSYVVTVDSLVPNCNAVSSPVNVTIGNPTATISGNTVICSGGTTTLTANAGTGYLWSNGATTQSISPGTSGNYTVTVTQSGGCTASDFVNVTVNSLPTPSITGTFTVCQGQSASLNAGAYSSYSWSSGAVSQTISPTVAGPYTVTVTDVNGCSASTSQNVTVNPLPTPVITGTFAFCQGGNTNLNAGGPYSIYQWSGGAASQVLNVITGGTYTVTVTNATGCTASTSQLVTVNPLPNPVITGTASICQGQTTSLNAGGPYTTYQWSGGGNTQSISVGVSGTYTVTVTDANGCINSATKNVTVNPLPTPVITGTFTVCQGQSASLNAGAYSSYSWSSGAVSQTISPTVAGPYTVTVTDVNGCSASTSQNVTVNPLPTPVITGTFAFCQGGNTNLNAGGPYSIYQWSGGAATQVLNVTTGGNYIVTVTNATGCTASTSQLVTVNPLPNPVITGTASICQGQTTSLNAGGPYTIYQWSGGGNTQSITVGASGTYTVTVTDANGCINSATKNVTVNPLPTPVITGTFTVCQGQSASLNAGAYSSYSWSSGAGSQTISPTVAGPYTVTVTDANGCSASTSQNVTVNPLPTPVITGTFAFCQGNNSNLNAGGPYTSYLWTGGSSSQVLNVATAGAYAVTVTNGFGCSASTSQLITVNPLPNPVISGNNICFGGATSLNAGGPYTTYLWSGGANTQSINVGVAGTYTVTVTNANGCINSATKTIVVNPLPIPSITGTFTVCQGQSASLNAGAYSSYSWSSGAGSQTISPTVAGPYTVTVTDVNGCSASTSQNVTVNPLPTPVITGTFAFCQGNNSNLNAGGPYTSYLWTGGSSSQVLNVATAGTYAVTVTNGFGCSASTSQLITVNPLPNPSISGVASICQGQSTILSAGGPYVTYQWSGGANTQTISVGTPGTVTVTVTDANGCVNSATKTVVVNPLPAPSITGTFTVCQGQSASLNAGAYSSYNWSSGAASQTINPTIAGTYTVTVTDANGCSASISQNVMVNPLPTPAITGNFVFCQGQSSVLDAGSGFNSYSWSNSATSQTINVSSGGPYTVTVTNGFGCINTNSALITVNNLPTPVISGNFSVCIGNSSTLNAGAGYTSYSWSTGASSQSISTTAAGNYTVTVIDNNGCIGNTSQAVIVNALPTPVITGNNAVCQGNSTIFDAGTGYISYHWSTGATTKSINVGTTGAYTVTVTDVNSCSNSTFKNLVVNALPQPVITGVNAVCDGSSSILTASPGFVNYLWSNNASASSISVNQTGNYIVTVTDNNGCVNSSSFQFTINAVPSVSFTNDSSLTCEIPNISFSNTSVFLPGAVFNWNFGDNSSSSAEQSPSHIYNLPGSYNVSLSIVNPNGCSSSQTQAVSVTFVPLPEAKFAADPKMTSVFKSNISFHDLSANAVTWNWDFGDEQKSNESSPVHYYDEIGDYATTLTITNIAGCVSTYREYISITPFYIPSAFTPNNDGKNELFYDPGFAPDVASYNMMVWNRWGQKVFEAADFTHFWNGKDATGKDLPQSTYVYTINIKTLTGKSYSYNGTVTLLR